MPKSWSPPYKLLNATLNALDTPPSFARPNLPANTHALLENIDDALPIHADTHAYRPFQDTDISDFIQMLFNNAFCCALMTVLLGALDLGFLGSS